MRASRTPFTATLCGYVSHLDPGKSVPPARDDVGFVVEPKPVMPSQNLSGGIESAAALSHFLRQPVVFDLGDVDRRIPRCKGRRGSNGARYLVGQRFHIVSEDRAVIGISVKVQVPPGRSQLIFNRAQ